MIFWKKWKKLRNEELNKERDHETQRIFFLQQILFRCFNGKKIWIIKTENLIHLK